MQFEIIGANKENYYLMAFKSQNDLEKGLFFYKIPISFFSDYLFIGESGIDFLIDVELYIERMYESLIHDGILNVISSEEFNDININFKGGIDEIIN